MKLALRHAYEAELRQASEAECRGELQLAWRHLERAHLHVHFKMLVHGWRRRDLSEVLGQVARLAVAAPGSWLGRAPRGNTGGADVGILTPMPIPEDLQAILAAHVNASQRP
jgi:hypothetical protein